MKTHSQLKRAASRTVRRSSAEEGYDSRWRQLSKQWRYDHPWCFDCFFEGRDTRAEHTDHIISFCGISDPLRMNGDNLQSLCASHNSIKALKEPKHSWPVQPNKVVVCGLPGTGKTTWARGWAVANGATIWDMDEVAFELGYGSYPRRPVHQRELVHRRDRFARNVVGACVIIIARPTHAVCFAAEHHMQLKHVHCTEPERVERLHNRALITKINNFYDPLREGINDPY